MRNKKVLTLCIIHDHPRVLLGMKKRGFGAGRWNGFGGKVAPGESVEDAAKRELFEEAGIRVPEMESVGKIDFEFKGESEVLEVNIFRAQKFIGEPMETEEMRPQWYLVGDIPFDEMWPDDRYWLPFFLEGKKFEGRFLFEGHDKILEHEIKLL